MSSHSNGQHMQKLICQKEKRGENEVRKVTQFACGVFFSPNGAARHANRTTDHIIKVLVSFHD